jgi:hypothetical protein
MHKNYKHGIVSGNTIRFGGYNNKTNRNYIIINDEKLKINKLNYSSYKNNIKNSKSYYDYDDEE